MEIMCIFALAMHRKRIYISLMLLLLPLGMVGQNLDYRILKDLQGRRTEGWDNAMRWVSNSVYLTPAVPLGMAVGGWAADNRDLRVDAATVGSAWGASIGVTMGLKYLVRRPRPYQRYEGDLLPVTTEPDPSFPSGHTTLAFATATSLSLLYPRWYVVAPTMLWATAVGFSRLYLGVHFPSDVLTGALIGAGAAVIAYGIARRLRQENPAMPKDAVVIPLGFSF